MVAIVTGKGTGLERSSAMVLGSRGQVGSAPLGRSGEGVYVNAANGNLVITRQDEILLGRGPDSSISRTYNSLALGDGDNGDDWQASVYRKIVGANGDATITRMDWDGSDTVYTQTAANTYRTTDGSGAHDYLYWSTATSKWTWNDGDTSITELYDSTGKLLSTSDSDGNSLTYTYTGALITRVTSANGEYTDLTYSGTLLTQLVTQAATGLTRIFYEYDASNRLSVVKVNVDPADNSKTVGANYSTTYTYHGTSTRVASIAQTDGARLDIAYDGSNRVSSLTQTAATGVTRVSTLAYFTGYTNVTDPQGGVTTLVYDAEGQLTQLTMPAAVAGGTAQTTSFYYNTTGDMNYAVTAAGGTRHVYDGMGNRTLTRDPFGNTVARAFSATNQLLRETAYLVPDPDGDGAGAASAPLTTRYVYDTLDHLRFIVTGDGKVTQHVYNAYGLLTTTLEYRAQRYDVSGLTPTQDISLATMTAWAGAITDHSQAMKTTRVYDARGNILSESTYGITLANGSGVTASDSSITSYVYDQAGNLLLKQQGNQPPETFIYDGLGRLTGSTDPNANSTSIVFNDSASSTVVTLANGLTQTSVYNRAGELVGYAESSKPNIVANASLLTGAEQWNVVNAQRVAGSLGDALPFHFQNIGTTQGATTTALASLPAGTTFDLSYMFKPGVSGTQSMIILQWYDSNGAYLSQNVFNQWPTDTTKFHTFEYQVTRPANAAKFTICVQNAPGSSDKWGGVTFAPAAAGPLETAITAYAYDSLGRLRIVTDPTGIKTYHVYDRVGRKVAEIGQGYSITEYAYNADNLLVRTVRRANPLSSGQISALLANPTTIELASVSPGNDLDDRNEWRIYDSANRLIQTIDSAGATTVLAYDGASRLVSSKAYATPIAAATVLGFNPTGYVAPGTSAANDRLTRNFYDADGLLIGTLDGEGGFTEHRYDGAGLHAKTIRYADPTDVALRATGTFAQLLGSITVDNANDIHNHSLFDNRGVLRGTIDGEGNLTRFRYQNVSGLLDQEVRGQKLDPAALLTTPPRWDALPAAGGAEILETIGYARNGAGDVTTETRTLASGAAENTTYSYDKLRKLLSTTVSGAGDVRTYNHRYDMFGRLIGELSGEGSAALAALGANPTAAAVDTLYLTWGTTYSYDGAGRLESMTRPNGVDASAHRTFFYYDVEDRLRYEINAKGEVTEYDYDALGNRIETTLYGTRIAAGPLAALNGGLLTSAVSTTLAGIVNAALDSHSFAEYNATGTVKQTSDALSYVTTYGYNAFREMISRVDPIDATNTVSSVVAYDRRGLLVSEMRDSAAGGFQLLTGFGYDAFGRRISETDPELKLRTTGYDRAGRVVRRTDAASASEYFTYDARGNMLTSTDRTGKVTTYGYNRFNRTITMTTAEGLVTTTTRNAHGETVSITDGGGRTTSYAYDKSGKLKTQTDAAGTLTRNYDKAGRLLEEIDRRNFKTSYTYDAASRMLTRKVNDGGLNLVTTWEYDAKGQQFKVTDPSLVATTITFDKKGQKTAVVVNAGGLALRTEYSYDRGGRVLTVTEGAGTTAARVTDYDYDKAGRVIDSWVDPAGLNLRTHYLYDKNGNVTNVTDAAGKVTVYTYDNENRQVFASDAEGRLTKTSYDAEGRVVATRHHFNRATLAQQGTNYGIYKYGITVFPAQASNDEVKSYVYDGDGRLRFSIDSFGCPCEYLYDGSGNLTRKVEYAGTIAYVSTDTVSGVQGKIAAAGLAALPATRTARSVFDTAGRQAFVISADGGVTAFTYDGNSNVVKQIAYKNLYTVAGDPTLAAMQSWAAGQALADARVSRTIYDGASRGVYRADETETDSYVAETQYDSAGRVSKQIRYAGKYAVADVTTQAQLQAAIGALPASAAVTAYTYDNAGRLTDLLDAEGSNTRFTIDATGLITDTILASNLPADTSTTRRVFDKGGRVTTETRAFGTAAASTTSYTYDGVGRATDTTFGYGTADASTTHRVFDAGGRVTSETRAYGTAEATTSSYGWDSFGNMLTETDGRNFTTTRTYDAAGQVLTVTVPLDATTNAVTTNQYDALGNLVKVTDPRGNAGYFYYDKLGRLTLQVDPEGYATRTLYARGGEVASVTRYATKLTATPVVGTEPSVPTNAALDATTAFTRDRLDRLTAVTNAENFTESYVLNAFGDRTSVIREIARAPDPVVTTTTIYAYDKLGRLTSETLPVNSVRADGTLQASSVTNKFEYDRRGNRTRMIEAFGLTEVRTTNFVYDKADRLISKTGDAVQVVAQDLVTTSSVTPTETYKYDARGNLIETVAASGARTLTYYDDLGRKTAEVSAVGTLSAWTYDANGNALTARVYGDAVALPGTAGGTAPSPVNAANYRQTSYVYDRANRLTETRVASLRTGEYGAAWATSVGDVVTQNVYDSAGNVVREIDGRSNSIFSFYDKIGRRIARVDQENYLTSWTLDAEGNALKEERFATQLTGTVTTGSNPASLRTSVAGAAGDRITDFVYDRNGRRTRETRLNVGGKSLTSTGALQDAGAHAEINYTYNGLGQVTRKVEANGDSTDYGYDLIGRQASVQSALYTDFQGASVRARTETVYDGVGNVTRSAETAKNGVAANDRVTIYNYGAGGRLQSTVDAVGFTRNYGYDADGRVVKESYSRLKSDLTTSLNEGVAYRYDLAGRLVFQAAGTDNGASWTLGDATQLRYDTYGDMTGKGINVAGGVFQETFEYDAGGRLWRSNSGDGSVRIHLYDRNGNATLTLASSGAADLATYSLESAAPTITSVGGTSIAGAVGTVSVYDKRGQLLQTREPGRQLSSSATAVLVRARAYNAFGEIVSEIDPRGFDASGTPINSGAAYRTTFTYNSMGRMLSKVSPQVAVTAENGTVSTANPAENYSYDLSGRLIGVQDANGSLTTRRLLAGSGHGEAEAIVLAEYHPGGLGVFQRMVDEFGDVRIERNELYDGSNATVSDEVMSYDKMGRLTGVTHRGGLLTDSYVHDGLGQRIRHTNSFLGTGNVERTDYDSQGRVTSSIAFGGDTTTTVYAWSSSLITTGLGTFGGWTETATYANGRTTVQQSGLFGQALSRTDLGGHVYSFGHDKAGRLTSQAVTGETLTYSNFNTGLIGSIGNGAGSSSVFAYDANGNRTAEWTQKSSVVVQNATAQYDALNRMTAWAEAGSATSPASSMTWEYDANGNIRRSHSFTWTLDHNGAPLSQAEQDYWYRFDTMNRVTTERGYLAGNVIYGGTGGADYLYNNAGQRVRAMTSASASQQFWDSDAYDPFAYQGWGGYTGNWVQVDYTDQRREDYAYDGAGNLSEVRIAGSTVAYDDQADTHIVTAPTAAGGITASYTNDAMGRVTRQIDLPGAPGYDRQVTYDAKGQISNETVSTKRWNSGYTQQDIYTSTVQNQFGAGSAYALGAVTQSTSTNTKGSTLESTVTTTNSYIWWDGATQNTSGVFTNYVSGTDTNYTTTYSYGPTGQMTSAYVGDGVPQTVTFTTDMAGQIIRRDEADTNFNTQTGGDPHEVWYRFGGRQLGYTGNNGSLDRDYLTTIDQRMRRPSTGAFRFDTTSPSVDFDPSLDDINSYGHGSVRGGYIVRAGDTLQTIAHQLWGDASLWYKLAEANGLSGGSTLTQGQALAIPSGVMRSTHNASTFKPYDAARAQGDTSPTQPKPVKKPGGCGMIGKILLVAVAVAVTVVTSGAALAAIKGISLAAGISGFIAGSASLTTMVVAGAVGGAAGSIASQGLGVATGLQDKFSWKSVGMAALSGAISAGMGKFSALSKIGSATETTAKIGGTLGKIGRFLGRTGFVGGAARGVTSSMLTQGIGVATGLQKKFDWTGVAAAGIGGGLSAEVGGWLNVESLDPTARFFANNVTGLAGGAANAAVRSLVDGTDFGDNLIAALPDVIGSTIGNMIAAGIANGLSKHDGNGKVDRSRARATLVLDPEPQPIQSEGINTNQDALTRAIEQAFELDLEIPKIPELTSDDPVLAGMIVEARIKAELVYGGTPLEGGRVVTIKPTIVDGKVEIEGGPSDGDLTLSGFINLRGLEGSARLLGTHFFDTNPDIYFGDVKQFRTRIELETANNHRMLESNIDYLTASGDERFEPYIKELAEVRDYRWENGGKQRAAEADRAAADLVKSGVQILDAPIAVYRVTVNEEYTFDNAVSIGGAAAGPAFKLGGQIIRVGGKTIGIGAQAADPIIVSGARAIDRGQSYEIGIRALYGEKSFRARQFTAIVDGQRVSGVADNVAVIGGRNTAVEAKYVDDWATSLRNPASRYGQAPWAIAEQNRMVTQAQKYAAGFEGGVVYHTNSVALAVHYSNAFTQAGIRNFRFVIVPAKR